MNDQRFTIKQILLFLIPSMVGGFSFMFPVPSGDGGYVIPITLLIKSANEFLADWLIIATVITICASAVFSIVASILKADFLLKNSLFNAIFNVKWYWVLLRVLGAVFVIMVFMNFGPEQIISEDTGSLVLYDLLASIILIAIIAGAILPLLVEFGLMEFVGTLIGPVFKSLFKIPGRSAVDCLSSWLGDTGVAVILTNGQLEKGYYTQREASVIVTTFSAVSITFALVVMEQVGFTDRFFAFYGAVAVVGIACAIIMPRIPPLSRKPDVYIVESSYKDKEYSASEYNIMQRAFNNAVNRASNNGYTPGNYFYDWAKNSLTLLFMLAPMVMAIGTLALILAEFTPVLEWIGYPFLPLLNLLQIPEAIAASTTMVAGFADMFIPAIIASGTIASPYTRFLIGVLSITQLIFISENGAMILASKIPVNLLELFIIFIQRTLISLVVASLFIRFVLQIPLI